MDQSNPLSNPLQTTTAPRPVPVMDVVMPRSEVAQPMTPTNAAPAPNDYASVTIPAPAVVQEAAPENAISAPAVTSQRSQTAPGVIMAITATVIIVLGIAALVTFAYLRTK